VIAPTAIVPFYGGVVGSAFYNPFYWNPFYDPFYWDSPFYGSPFYASLFYGSPFSSGSYYGSSLYGSSLYGSSLYGSSFYGSSATPPSFGADVSPTPSAQAEGPPSSVNPFLTDVPSGSLRLNVEPKTAQVFVDGYYAGVVDDFSGRFQRLNVRLGPHHVEVRAPGYEPLHLDVNIVSHHTMVYRGVLMRSQP
jgi:hypothetical protein